MTFADRKPPALQRFKPYPAYKNSGVEWLGEIPAHWEVKSIRALARERERGEGEKLTEI